MLLGVLFSVKNMLRGQLLANPGLRVPGQPEAPGELDRSGFRVCVQNFQEASFSSLVRSKLAEQLLFSVNLLLDISLTSFGLSV